MLTKNELLQGRYRIIRQLGHGGMGAVYEAQDERLGSSVALKEIIIELDKIPPGKQRELFMRAFEREAKLLANLHHEAFPRVMDYFSEEDRQFLIMELIHGDDLGALLDKNKQPFALRDILKWTDQLLDALDYLHTQTPPIYHRDIKPQNLKATLRGKIKLLDFGIAKSLDNASSTMTNHTFVGATLNYSPIEQVLPAIAATFREFIVLKYSEKAKVILDQNTNAQCDIYAVGATLYHLLTNRVPVESTKRSLEIWEGNADPLPNPSGINPEITPAISAFLLKAMQIERENRFATAIEMQEALQIIIAEETRQKTDEGKTLLLVEPLISPTVKEEINYAQTIRQAVTEGMISDGQTIPEKINEMSANTRAAQTQASNTQFSDIELLKTKSPKNEVFKTPAAGNIFESEIPKTSYFAEKPVDERQTAPVTLIEPEPIEAASSGAKRSWLLPLAALGILTVGGIGGAIWLNGPSSPVSNKPTANVAASTLTIQPSISPTIQPGISSGASPTVSPTTVQNISEKNKPKPTIAPTQNKTPVQNTVKPTTQKTSKPKPQQDPNCVFTNSCK